jgi:hypothetical protein
MRRWVQPCSPENLIRHPIANTWEALLHEEHGLQGGVRTAVEETAKNIQSEGFGE